MPPFSHVAEEAEGSGCRELWTVGRGDFVGGRGLMQMKLQNVSFKASSCSCGLVCEKMCNSVNSYSTSFGHHSLNQWEKCEQTPGLFLQGPVFQE